MSKARKKTAIDYEETAWGDGKEVNCNWKASRENPDCHRGKVQLLSDTQQVELPLQTLSPHVKVPFPQAMGGHCTRADLLMPATGQ